MAAGTHKMAPRGSEDHPSTHSPTHKAEKLIPWCLNLAVQDNHRSSFEIQKNTYLGALLWPYTSENPGGCVFLSILCDSAAQPGLGSTGLQD